MSQLHDQTSTRTFIRVAAALQELELDEGMTQS